MNRGDEKKYWLDDPRNVTLVYRGLMAVCWLLLALDLFYHKHPHFAAESRFGFYGLYGFFCCVGLVLAARLLRLFVKRGEDYYDR